MPYTFRDTNSAASNYVLPSEALRINDEYIEELFANDLTLSATYQTLNVQGRELSAQEAESIEVGIRHGAYLKSRRFPPREITVTYKLEATTNEHFRKAFNRLNEILNVKDAQLIFDDEPDKFFIGTVTEVDDVDPGRNAVVGKFTITCYDPFKYSTTLYTAEPDDTGNFVINYGGTMPAYPVLESSFYASDAVDNHDGDCGYVAFFNDKGATLQFGVPSESDIIEEKIKKITSQTTVTTTTHTRTDKLLNEQFNSLGSWVQNQGYLSNDVAAQVGSARCGYLPKGDDMSLMPYSYIASGQTGSNYPGWHGPTVKRSIPNPTNGTRSPNGQFGMGLRLAGVRADYNSAGQRDFDRNYHSGEVQMFLLDSSGMICGFSIWKNPGQSIAKIRTYVSGAGYTDLADVDLKTNFGYPPSGSKANNRIVIKKTGGKFEFDIGGSKCTINNNALANRIPTIINFFFGQWKGYLIMSRVAVYDCYYYDTAVKYTVSTAHTTENISYLSNFVDITNTFSTNDKLIADCNSADVRMLNAKQEYFGDDEDKLSKGASRPDLGALGNQWEEFSLLPGTNQIGFAYSDWVESQFAPTPKIYYREVFL